jgi:hypothetical protein
VQRNILYAGKFGTIWMAGGNCRSISNLEHCLARRPQPKHHAQTSCASTPEPTMLSADSLSALLRVAFASDDDGGDDHRLPPGSPPMRRSAAPPQTLSS